MAPPPTSQVTSLIKSWAMMLARLAEPLLLLNADEGVLAGTAAARKLLGSALEVPGTPVRRVLGLPGHVPLEGKLELRPPASGLTVQASLHCTPLYEPGGQSGSLLLIVPRVVAEPTNQITDIEGRLREMALTISSALDIEQVLERVVRLSVDLIGAAGGALPLYDSQFDRLLASHVVGIDATGIKSPMVRGVGAIWHLIDTGESFMHNAYAEDPRAMPLLVAAGVHAVAAAPVRAGDQILGVINLYHTSPGRTFTRRDLELLEMIGRHAGVALQNARRYEQALRESERRSLLYRASVSFGAALAPEQLYTAIHKTLAQMMPCDTIAIALLDAPEQAIEYVYLADGRGRWPNERVPVSRGLLGTVIRTGLSLRVIGSDPEIESLFGAEPFGEGEDATGSLVAVALRVGEQIIGAITVQAISSGAYTTDDLDALEALGATAAIALQNAHLFARVQELATTDSLTGVANRRHFFDLARLEIERAMRYRRPLSMLMLDADHFKQINDRYGHLAGDEVLRTIAARCRSSLREVDVLGRYGGEEFLVLLPETSSLRAMQVADRLREVVCATPVPTSSGPVAVQVSVGVSSLAAGARGSVETLLDQVDQALYRAKAAGRNKTRSS